MPKGHYKSAGGRIQYGDATDLFPVDELNATVHQYRDAERVLENVRSEDVICVYPESMATGYALGQNPLTAIRVETLPATVRGRLGDALDAAINSFAIVQVGKWVTSSPNRSLSEYETA
ncbi:MULTISPECIES: hypothetical protein [unclassified Halorubrum]|jgi:hypothetical protein|uniref:hypothetical protein n=1 Tax=unclassified Halorubrum TaxID=2642239 RepID=UPI000B0A929C|nr:MULTISPECIES: hypothetical protein [unclassified Halorubrum]TKX37783.1 hypothetical protein EXE52_14055 [Halorubrum sp. CGM4_25_10-8A]TKX80302.1 hypothetical protein EXE53_11060 [Halorubrum sp. SD626R]